VILKGLPQVDVGILVNVRETAPGEDGYIGDLTIGDRLKVHITVYGTSIHPFMVGGTKNVDWMGDQWADMDPTTRRALDAAALFAELTDAQRAAGEEPVIVPIRRFTKNMTVEASDSGPGYIPYNSNNVRLLVVGEDGQVAIWEVAIVSQNGRFFLTSQQVHAVRCFNRQGRLACPYFEEAGRTWPQLVEAIATKIDVATLPDITRWMPSFLSETELTNGNAVVRWFNLASGMGAIRTSQGDVRVHWSQVPERPELRYLLPGEAVKIDRIDALTGGRSSFKFEAKGVTLA